MKDSNKFWKMLLNENYLKWWGDFFNNNIQVKYELDPENLLASGYVQENIQCLLNDLSSEGHWARTRPVVHSIKVESVKFSLCPLGRLISEPVNHWLKLKLEL